MKQEPPPSGSEVPQEKVVDKPGRTDWVVFGLAAVLAVAFIAWGLLGTESLQSFADSALTVLVRDGGWIFILAATGFVFFGVWLAISNFGKIRLGNDDEKPEFRTSSWIAMMFAAGMGIGLMFYGVSEPLTHFSDPPPGSWEAGSDAAVGSAMATSLFHWTLHPWSIYAVVGLALAYSSYRRGRPQLLSSAFAPLFGEKAVQGFAGKIIDGLTIFATVFGTAASLGVGTTQIAAGLDEVGWIPGGPTQGLLIGIVVVLIACFVISAVSGVSKGIQYLSNTNMILALLLAVFLFAVGPTVFIMNMIPSSLGSYFSDFGEMVSRNGSVGGEDMLSFLSSWTIFYWAWWISWAPFVGMFIARISRGRTIREFVGGVILVPSVISVVWFAILGGTALFQERSGAGLTDLDGAEQQLFGVFNELPLSGIASVLAMLLIINFFVTSADSASVVLGSLSQGGSARPQKWVVVFWGVIIGGVAVSMLLVGGDDALTGLQNTTIIAASPFVILVVVLCVGLLKDLRADHVTLREAKGSEILEQAVITGTEEHQGEFALAVTPLESDESDTQGR